MKIALSKGCTLVFVAGACCGAIWEPRERHMAHGRGSNRHIDPVHPDADPMGTDVLVDGSFRAMAIRVANGSSYHRASLDDVRFCAIEPIAEMGHHRHPCRRRGRSSFGLSNLDYVSLLLTRRSPYKHARGIHTSPSINKATKVLHLSSVA
jgi:hypothetical protein